MMNSTGLIDTPAVQSRFGQESSAGERLDPASIANACELPDTLRGSLQNYLNKQQTFIWPSKIRHVGRRK